jgi:hypothetical protein
MVFDLKLIEDNPHDAQAIAVMHNGEQIGWVAAAQNVAVRKALAGRLGQIRVKEWRPNASTMERLRGDVQLAESVSYFIRACDLHSGSGVGYSKQALFDPSGEYHHLKWWTTTSRTSISFGVEGTDICVYVLKTDLPDFLVRRMQEQPSLFHAYVVHVDGTSGIRISTASNDEFGLWAKDAEDYAVLTHTISNASNRTGRVSGQNLNHAAPYQSEKETTMSLNQTISAAVSTAVESNKSAAAQAGYIEAGRILNNKAVELVSKSKAVPLLARGYVDTAFGKLVIANAAQIAVRQMRPNDKTLTRLSEAMAVAAYQELIQTIDIEGMIDNLLNSPEVLRAKAKLGETD